MFKKNLFILFSFCCTTTNLFAQNNNLLTGYWAMQPLNNGIANVIYFDGNGTTTLYPFECDYSNKSVNTSEAEAAKYEVEDNKIHLIYPDPESNQTLIIKKLETSLLVLEQPIFEEHTLKFEYQKVKSLNHLCPTQ